LVSRPEEHRLRVFENNVLRISDPKRDEVTGERRNLSTEKLQNLYSSPNIIRMIKETSRASSGDKCMGTFQMEQST
jgi:hypothetical protein